MVEITLQLSAPQSKLIREAADKHFGAFRQHNIIRSEPSRAIRNFYDNFECAAIAMDKKIIVYGYADKTEHGFPTEKDLVEYINEGIFKHNDSRHRYTQAKKAGIIVVSRDGFAYGHMIIEKIVDPTSQDIERYPKVKKVYIVKSTAVYKKRVKLKELGIRVSTFGTPIGVEQFDEIKSEAIELEECFP
jgi:hypothetical protein